MSTETFPQNDGGGENLFKFLGLSLAIHLVALLVFYAFAPLRDTLFKAIPPKEPIVVDVIDLPQTGPKASLIGKNRSVDKEVFHDANVGRGLIIVPRSEPTDKTPLPSPKGGKRFGGTAASKPPGETPVKSVEKETPGKTLPGEDTVALKSSEAGKPSDTQTPPPSAPSAITGEGAGTATTKIKPPRPNLFLTDDRLAELTKKYESEAPKGEKGKILRFNTSEVRYQKYINNMRIKIESIGEYPATASRNGWQGIVLIDNIINKDGTIKELRVVKSSGYPVIDDAAITNIRLASPFPTFPDDFGVEEITIKWSYEFIIYGLPPGRR